MSEDKKIRVVVEDAEEDSVEDVKELKAERDELKATLEVLSAQAFEEYKNEIKQKFPEKASVIDSIESPSQLNLVKDLLSGEKRSVPSGTVSLQPNGERNIRYKEFDTAKEMVDSVYNEAKTDPDLENALNELWKKSLRQPSGKWVLQEPEPRIKSPSHRYVYYKNSFGNTVMVPENHAKTLDPELLKKRLASGYYG